MQRRTRTLSPLGFKSFTGTLATAATCALILLPCLSMATARAAGAPVNTEAPRLTGTAEVGQTLTCSHGVWSGNVTSYSYAWSSDGQPIAGQSGETYTVPSAEQGQTLTCQVTASDQGGEYAITGLPSGIYGVSFTGGGEAGNFMSESFGARVAVTAGATTGEVDSTLGTGGEISGRVTSSSAHADLAGVRVCAIYEARYEACVATNAGGEYTITGLQSGRYSVLFQADHKQSRFPVSWEAYYGGVSGRSGGTLVAVTAGSLTPGIDAEMKTGEIAGEVQSAGRGVALAGIEVCAGQSVPVGVIGACTHTDATGKYAITGLEAGTYHVAFFPNQGENYITQYYDGQTEASSANALPVKAGETVSGVDAQLQEGGTIPGIVTSAATGAHLAGVRVCVELISSIARCATTNGQGEYQVTGLPTGSYKVQFDATAGLNYLSQYFDDASSASEAATVPVTAGHATEAVDAALRAGGQIVGRVTSAATHAPVEHISVCTVHGNAQSVGSCALTNSEGEYAIVGLSTGSYVVRFARGFEGPDYAAQYFNGQTSLGLASPIAVELGHATPGVDAEMLPAGEISGRVTSALDGVGIGGIKVCANLTESAEERGIGEGYGCALTSSASSGTATSNALSVALGGTGTTTDSAAGGSLEVPGRTGTTTAGKMVLLRTAFNAKTNALDLYLRVAEGGEVHWRLTFDQAHVSPASGAGPRQGRPRRRTRAALRRTRACARRRARGKRACGLRPTLFSNGATTVKAGAVEIVIHPRRRARRALEAGDSLRIAGLLTFRPADSGGQLSESVSLLARGRRRLRAGRRSSDP